jgi:hypothetical protein
MTIPALAHRSLHGPTKTSRTTGTLVLWITAAIAALLFVASLTGNGSGFYRTGILTSMIWVWVLMPLIIIAIFAGLLLHRQPAEH